MYTHRATYICIYIYIYIHIYIHILQTVAVEWAGPERDIPSAVGREGPPPTTPPLPGHARDSGGASQSDRHDADVAVDDDINNDVAVETGRPGAWWWWWWWSPPGGGGGGGGGAPGSHLGRDMAELGSGLKSSL